MTEPTATEFPMQVISTSLEDGTAVYISLTCRVIVSHDAVEVMLVNGDNIVSSGMMSIPQAPTLEAPESDADVLRRIAYDLAGPDWSECDE